MDNVVGPDGGSSSRNGVIEEFETRCLVDLNRLNVQGMPAQIPHNSDLGPLAD